MTLVFTRGDIFKSGASILVNPVNCVGVAGAGLALEFKRRYPLNHAAYVWACENRLLDAEDGRLHIFSGALERGAPRDHPVIINFPTKRHWRDKSTIWIVQAGLCRLRRALDDLANGDPETTVAMPALGCGLGGLRWGEVRHSIKSHLGGAIAQVTVFEPQGDDNTRR